MSTRAGSSYLLDSHVLVYLAQHPERLPRRLRSLIEDGGNELHVSIASLWEIQIKALLGKLSLDMPLDRLITTQRDANGLRLLPITLSHIVEHERLPMHHRDPFDRMLVAQARVEGLVLLSADAQLKRYDVRLAGEVPTMIQTDDLSSHPAPRVVSAAATTPNEEVFERALRPKALDEYIGQTKIREQLEIFIGAARKRNESLDHVLLFGPPGLGKTTLAHIVAREMGVHMRQTSGPVLERPGDLAALLTNLEKNDVLFIDEIHRLSPVVEEILYPALEDFQIDIMIGEGPAARSVKLDLQPFTLVGATTRAGMLTNPLRDRFGIVARLEFYTPEEVQRIVLRSAALLATPIDADGAMELAKRSRGTPRIANRLLRRVRDFADMRGDGRVTSTIADQALKMLDVDALGLDVMDRKLLEAILHKFDGGPVGLDNLASAIGEERDTIEDVIEPFLIQQGFLHRTPRGRVATQTAYRHFGLTPPAQSRTGELWDAT